MFDRSKLTDAGQHLKLVAKEEEVGQAYPNQAEHLESIDRAGVDERQEGALITLRQDLNVAALAVAARQRGHLVRVPILAVHHLQQIVARREAHEERLWSVAFVARPGALAAGADLAHLQHGRERHQQQREKYIASWRAKDYQC